MIGAPVSTNISAPPLEPLTVIFDYAGGNNLIYKGWAKSGQGLYTAPAVSAFSAASPGVLTFASAHGYNWVAAGPTAQPSIAISGGTGNWKAVNGIWIFQPTAATTGTLASVVAGSLTQLDTTGFGAVTGTLVVTSRAPRTFDPCWSIQLFVYNASNAEIWSGWPTSSFGAGAGLSQLGSGSSAMNHIWDNRALLGYC